LHVTQLHLGLELAEDADRFSSGRPHGVGSAAAPGGQLDELAIKEPQVDGRVERRRRDKEGQRGRLPGARLTPKEHVALGEADGDLLPVLVDTDRDRIPQAEGLGRGVRPDNGLVAGERIAADEDDRRELSVARIAGDPNLADSKPGGDDLGRVLKVSDDAVGRDRHLERVAGRHFDRAEDAW